MPDSLAGLRTDEVLSELARDPAAHRQSFALGLDIELQGLFDEPGGLRSLGFLAWVAKWAPLRRYFDLHPVELSNPFAGQIRIGTCRDGCEDEQEGAQRDSTMTFHDNPLGEAADRR
jgi:hypothetical protein